MLNPSLAIPQRTSSGTGSSDLSSDNLIRFPNPCQKQEKEGRKGRVVLVFTYPEQDLGRVTSEARTCGLAPMPEGEHDVNISEVNLMSIVSY